MDPLVVFSGVVLVSILAFALTDLLLLLIVLCLCTGMALFYRRDLARFSRMTKGLLTMVFVIAFLQVLLYRDEIPLTVQTPLGDAVIVTSQGLEMAGRIASRVGILFSSTLVFNASIGSGEFINALGRTRLPYQLILALDISIRAVPRMMNDATEIRDAYLMVHRGKRYRGPFRGWLTYIRLAKPLFLTYMGKAWRLGTSLELRGFSSRPIRMISPFRPHWKDGVAFLVYVAAVLMFCISAGIIPFFV